MQSWLRQRSRSWKAHTSMQPLMGLLAFLIGLFFTGMLLLSHLNLNYSQQAMSDLRRDQIRDVFFASVARIDARQIALQRHTSSLAIIGETFYRLARERRNDTSNTNALRAQLETSLKDHLSEFDGASGAGIWFEPEILAGTNQSYSAHFTKSDAESEPTLIRNSGGYRSARWFERTLDESWSLDQHVPGQVYWSAVYFDFATKRAVLTLASPMFNADKELIGMATTGWASDQIIDLVSRVEVTENSFSFLNDRNNRNLSSLSLDNDTFLEQKLIDAILALQLSARLPDGPGLITPSTVQPERLQTRAIEISGRVYELYYAATPAGMVYGAGVPRDEIDRVLVPMRDINYRILVTTGSVLLILSIYLLYRIVQLIRELQASYTDPLTGLPNRARLLKDLAVRSEACLIIVNLDRFQEINSLFGTACGDQVLLTLSEQLQLFVKNHIKDERARVYRLTGDEFALLGPVIAEAKLRQLANKLSDFLHHQRISWQQQVLSVDATTGIAFRPLEQSAASRDQLLSQAAIALRLAREQRRNYLIYDSQEQIEKHYEQNLYWAQRLKDALAQGRVIPHFQPIYDNRQRRISKYECLVRMIDEEHGVIAAGQFLGIVNKLRLDREITRIMIDKSLAEFRHQPYEFSINMSYADLVEPEILELILGHLRASNIGKRLIFEILESDGIENYNEALHFIEQVKPFGCQIAIDDFGTGYSNFEQLLRLNIDIIKIDGSLVRNLDQDETAFVVTNGIVQFAKSLGIRTVAEFVHSEAVQAKVLELGIDFSQGEYFSMPGPRILAQKSGVAHLQVIDNR
ncbi:bifunctional diguanylate cyclase/phosphodiesterase [Marinobacter changyiensis]|uniref:bifunctional diguanylate cyclase/phosphodiesterase n=1 Tax=Marinobacter changyiensis TaxID=2604091 RepID=UPI0012650B1B|nr:EAL domain-containing protein [Marinobacter changyiensis]